MGWHSVQTAAYFLVTARQLGQLNKMPWQFVSGSRERPANVIYWFCSLLSLSLSTPKNVAGIYLWLFGRVKANESRRIPGASGMPFLKIQMETEAQSN